MRAAQRKAPEPAGAGSGAGTSAYEKLPAHFNPDSARDADDALAILRQAQAVVAGMATAADRLDRTARRLIGGAR